jgi:hypothetical protein
MKNKYFELTSGITVVLRRTSNDKEKLIAGVDFFYVDSSSIPQMQVDEDAYWSIFTRKDGGSYVVVRMKNKAEKKLSRLLMDVIGDRSTIVTFANNHFYDLRKLNLLVSPIGSLDTIETKRRPILETMEELPTELHNVLIEKNGNSLPQKPFGSITPSLKIEAQSMYNMLVTLHGIHFKAMQLTEEEKIKATESFQFLEKKFAVVT